MLKGGNEGRCFIIGEAGVNHNGDVILAKRLVDAAAEAGVDAVKFQTFKAEKIVTPGAEKADYQMRTTERGETQYGMLKRLELSYDDHAELFNYCTQRGVMFISTPFDMDSVDMLEGLGVGAYKVGSGDLTDMPLLKHIARKKRPVLLSTGMADLEEVEEAIGWIRAEGNRNITLLHCTSSYPTHYDDVNLKAMDTLRSAFNLPVGYSDHTPGISIPVAAAALGACIIEKHFTLDREMDGPDHRASLEPGELKAMVQSIRDVERAMGDGIKRCRACEQDTRRVARKSIVAVRDISKGERIDGGNIAIKRPGMGIPPKHYYSIMGYEAAEDIKRDTPLSWDLIREGKADD